MVKRCQPRRQNNRNGLVLGRQFCSEVIVPAKNLSKLDFDNDFRIQ